MKIIAIVFLVLITQQSSGQLCKELSLFIQKDSLKAINHNEMDTLFNIIERYFLNSKSQNYASGKCIVKQKYYYGEKFDYELFYCREKQLCTGMLVRNIGKNETDTMTFLYDFSKMDKKARADTVMFSHGHVNYMLNINNCFYKFIEFVSNFNHYIIRENYFDLENKGFFTVFKEDEPPYMKMEYIIIRGE